MRRREFIAGLGGAAAWPLAARAQQPVRMRHIGIILPAAADNAEFQARTGAFLQGLALLGWNIGRNVRVDTRWGNSQYRRNTQTRGGVGCVDAGCHSGQWRRDRGSVAAGNSHRASRIYTFTPDPVGAGYVETLARPGGKATGFMAFEYSLSGKWLALLKQIAPSVTRAAVLRDATQRLRNQRVCRHPDRGVFAQNGGEPRQCARR